MGSKEETNEKEIRRELIEFLRELKKTLEEKKKNKHAKP